MLWIFVVVLSLSLCYWLLKRPHSYWKNKGIPQSNPTFILGDIGPTLFRTTSTPEVHENWYKIGENSRYCGVYTCLTPHLIIRDPDLIKQITIKDFDHFFDHRGFVPEDSDPLLDKNLLNLNGQKWREMRLAVSPAFSRNKMKYMFSLMCATSEVFVQHFLNQNKNLIKLELKDAVTRFTSDVIANTVFGYECNSLENPKNEFYLMGQKATDFSSFKKIFTFMLFMIMPKIARFLNLTLLSKDLQNFYFSIVKDNIKSREQHGIVRPDIINLLLEARKHMKQDDKEVIPDAGFATTEESEGLKNQNMSKHLEITDQVITNQAFSFLLAGFDFISTAICFMCHELAINPDCQERLRQEIDDTKENCNGKITYEALATMKYMDMCVSETLRKYPPTIGGDRRCTKPYVIEPKYPNEKPLRLEKDDFILIPTYGIHRDPQYYPDPERFDPERFNDENKAKIKPCTFMPFGSGPRNCIGSRYSILEVKVFMYHLLSTFEIVPIENTQIPLKFNRKSGTMATEKGFWLGLQRREF